MPYEAIYIVWYITSFLWISSMFLATLMQWSLLGLVTRALKRGKKNSIDQMFCETHHPLWSIHWRRSSMGGWAPYFSRAGIARSSTKITHCLPFWGPNTPGFRLKSFPSIMPCVWFALVCAEKLKKTDCHLHTWEHMFYTIFYSFKC
jgi:hypothetical protein